MDNATRQQAYRARQLRAGRVRAEFWVSLWEQDDLRRRLEQLRGIGQERHRTTADRLQTESVMLARNVAHEITAHGMDLETAHRELLRAVARIGGNWSWARAEVSNELEDFPALRARWDALTN